MECVYSLGPLCWTEAYKFYIWLGGMIVIWSTVGFAIYRNRQYNKRIAELIERIRQREGSV